MSRTIFYGPKDVRPIEVRLYEEYTMTNNEKQTLQMRPPMHEQSRVAIYEPPGNGQ